MEKTDSVLIWWLILTFIWDVFLIAGTSYLVFWKGVSGWWFVLAIVIGLQPSLYKALNRKHDN